MTAFFDRHCLLLTLPTAHCSLPTAHCSLLTAHCFVIGCARFSDSAVLFRARMTIRRLLETGEPNHAALILADHAITYQELDDQIVQATEQLIQLGFRKGDRIGLAFPNGLEMIVSFLAASTVGTAAPLNPAYTRDEFKFYLEDTTARGLVVPRKSSVWRIDRGD